jgi:hypothetical protein
MRVFTRPNIAQHEAIACRLLRNLTLHFARLHAPIATVSLLRATHHHPPTHPHAHLSEHNGPARHAQSQCAWSAVHIVRSFEAKYPRARARSTHTSHNLVGRVKSWGACLIKRSRKKKKKRNNASKSADFHPNTRHNWPLAHLPTASRVASVNVSAMRRVPSWSACAHLHLQAPPALLQSSHSCPILLPNKKRDVLSNVRSKGTGRAKRYNRLVRTVT